jgi:menaquinone-dependent protoporphyrinogen oxidase
VTDIDGYQAVVLGSAAYMFHWLKPAVRFARHQTGQLRQRVYESLPAAGIPRS